MPPVPICYTNTTRTTSTRPVGTGRSGNHASLLFQSENGSSADEENISDLDETDLDSILDIMMNPQCNGGMDVVDDAKLQHLLDVLENLGTDVPAENSNKLNEDNRRVSTL